MKSSSIIIGTVILASILMLIGLAVSNSSGDENINNVSYQDEVQIIDIKAKGGYSPRKTIATANVPTILRINTKSTFDCSSYLVIPSLNLNKVLPSTGSTEIDLGTPKPGKFEAFCSMGMYYFQIEFTEPTVNK